MSYLVYTRIQCVCMYIYIYIYAAMYWLVFYSLNHNNIDNVYIYIYGHNAIMPYKRGLGIYNLRNLERIFLDIIESIISCGKHW